MTSNLIPLPSNHEQWIDTLWHIHIMGKLTITEQQYRVYWPLVDGFWSHRKTEKHLHGRFQTHYYTCRLSQQRVSSKAKPYPSENISGKTRVTSCRIPSTCSMRIKIIEPLEVAADGSKIWSVQQVLDRKNPELRTHNHTIDASWKHKRSSFLTNIIQEELAKGYTPGQVKDRLQGSGRVAGYERLESIGGAFMKRYAYYYKVLYSLLIYIQERLCQFSKRDVVGYSKTSTRYNHS